MSAEIAVAAVGIALVACALIADRPWFDRHFLPSFFVSRHLYLLAFSLARTAVAAIGMALAIFVRPRIGRYVERTPPSEVMADAARISLAFVLALGTSELILRLTFRRSSEEQPASQAPLRRRDQSLGWVFVPGRSSHDSTAGRTVEYTFDSAGYRVRDLGDSVNPDLPTVLFAGESIMAGQALTWEETIPAQVGTLLGMQSANLAVHGFATDQSYLRLVTELPRFRRPGAVVALFTPGLFDRNLDEDRPHLGPGLVWLPANPHWRLTIIGNWVAPYRSLEVIEQGIEMTRSILRAIVDLARARQAIPLIVVPQFLPEDPTELVLRRRILDETGLPYVWVGLNPAWRLPSDRHPGPQGASAIAAAIATRLRAP